VFLLERGKGGKACDPSQHFHSYLRRVVIRLTALLLIFFENIPHLIKSMLVGILLVNNLFEVLRAVRLSWSSIVYGLTSDGISRGALGTDNMQRDKQGGRRISPG
jgi:hypothetical protein